MITKKVVGSLFVFVLLCCGMLGMAYTLSNYDEKTTDVYDVPIQVYINPSSIPPSWSDVAYKGITYKFMLEVYSAENATAILKFMASPCDEANDVVIQLKLHDTMFPFTQDLDGTALSGTFDSPFALNAGETLMIPCEVVFKDSGRFTVGFYFVDE